MNKREECLRKACECVNGDRNSEYGEPENNLRLIAEFWSSYLGINLTPSDVANMMVLLKVARTNSGKPHLDNYIDMAGYASLAYEVAETVKDDTSIEELNFLPPDLLKQKGRRKI